MKYVIQIVILVYSFGTFAQERATIEKNKSYRKTQEAFAERYISEMSEGVLLVRLDKKQKQIDYLESFENDKAADKIRRERTKINAEIIRAFKEEFDFIPVYFFGMKDSQLIRENKLDSVVFVDTNNQIVEISPDIFSIAEFGRVEQDTSYYYSDSYVNTASTNPSGKSTRYYGGDKLNVSALVLRDKQFNQLREPFPFYERYFPSGRLTIRYKTAVRKWNDALKAYNDQMKVTRNNVAPMDAEE